MHHDEKTIRQTYEDYLGAFHTLDAKAVAPFYAVPCLFVTDPGVVLMTEAGDVERLFATLIEELRARDYDHSEVKDLEVRLLSEYLALVSGLAIRFAKDGSELERTGATYTMRKVEGAWKFATVVAHTRENAFDR